MAKAAIYTKEATAIARRCGTTDALALCVDPFLKRIKGAEEVLVSQWHDNLLYIEVRDRTHESPCSARCNVTFDAVKGVIVRIGEGKQYSFTRRGWVRYLTELLGAEPPIYYEADGTKAKSARKTLATKLPATLEEMAAHWEKEANSLHMLWKSAAMQIAQILRKATSLEEARANLRKVTPKQMAISASYERAINDVQSLIRRTRYALSK